MSTQERPLNSKETAEALRISVDTLLRWVSIGYGPKPKRIGYGKRGRWYWSQSQIDQFMASK
jgi:predicted DNA-binding transcriptional regulator AlpA